MYSNRGRYKDGRDPPLSSNRNSFGSNNSGTGNGFMRPSNNGARPNHTKSPKPFKKNFPPGPGPTQYSPQAPPPPPGPAHSPVESASEGGSQVSSSGSNVSTSSSSQSQSASSKPERLSYAQMTQRSKPEPVTSTEGGGAKSASSLPISPQTTPPAAPPPQSIAKSIKSTSSAGSLSATGQGQSSGVIASKSAPTSPTKESGGVASERSNLKSKENEV